MGRKLRKIQSMMPGAYGLKAVTFKKTAGGWIPREEPAYIKEETGTTFKLVTVKEGEISLPENKYARIGNMVFMAEVSEGKYRSLKVDLDTGKINIAKEEKLQHYKNEVDKAYRKYKEGKPTFFDKWGTPIIIAAIISILTIPTYIMYTEMTEMNKTNQKTAEAYLELANKLEDITQQLQSETPTEQTPEQPTPPP